jgi:ABC-type multidrug transport system fused ATPase/permease subunit
VNFPARQILSILTKKERKKFFLLAVADVLISFVDIFSLAVLVYVVNTLAQPDTTSAFNEFAKQNSILITGLLCVLFCAKNWLAQMIFKQQQQQGYSIAARISENKLTNYLDGDFKNYSEIHSSIHIRSISQQPIEFIHYMLRNLQSIFNQSVLILFSIIAILLYNATLFILLFAILTPLLLVTGMIIQKKNKHLKQNAKKASELSLQYLQESLDAYIEANIFNKKDFFRSRYAKAQTYFNSILAEQQAVQNFPSRFSEAFGVIGLFILLVINEQLLKVPLSFITLGAFVMAAYKIVPGAVKILTAWRKSMLTGFRWKTCFRQIIFQQKYQ